MTTTDAPDTSSGTRPDRRARVHHGGLVTPDGANPETGRALWRASCACGWFRPTSARRENAQRALTRHLKASRPPPPPAVETAPSGTGAGTGRAAGP